MASTPINLLRQSGTVERKTEAVDAGGSPVETWATHLSNVRMSIQPMKTAKALQYGAERARRMYTVFVAPDQDVLEGDRIAYIDNRTGTNTTRYLRVESAPINLIEQDVVLELDCEALGVTP